MDFIYTINRSKRRSLAIKIREGEVRVAAPNGMSDRHIANFVEQKRDWITGHLQQQHQQLNAVAQREWAAGETIQWLGEPLTITVMSAGKNTAKQGEKAPAVQQVGNELQITLSPRVKNTDIHVRKHVMQWFMTQAEAWLADYLKQPQAVKLKHSGTRIANYTGKWGSCSKAGVLSFTWKLWLAPEAIVQYVVQHELAHLSHFDHSPDFWALVGELNPDYREAEKWLRQHGTTVLSERYLAWA